MSDGDEEQIIRNLRQQINIDKDEAQYIDDLIILPQERTQYKEKLQKLLNFKALGQKTQVKLEESTQYVSKCVHDQSGSRTRLAGAMLAYRMCVHQILLLTAEVRKLTKLPLDHLVDYSNSFAQAALAEPVSDLVTQVSNIFQYPDPVITSSKELLFQSFEFWEFMEQFYLQKTGQKVTRRLITLEELDQYLQDEMALTSQLEVNQRICCAAGMRICLVSASAAVDGFFTTPPQSSVVDSLVASFRSEPQFALQVSYQEHNQQVQSCVDLVSGYQDSFQISKLEAEYVETLIAGESERLGYLGKLARLAQLKEQYDIGLKELRQFQISSAESVQRFYQLMSGSIISMIEFQAAVGLNVDFGFTIRVCLAEVTALFTEEIAKKCFLIVLKSEIGGDLNAKQLINILFSRVKISEEMWRMAGCDQVLKPLFAFYNAELERFNESKAINSQCINTYQHICRVSPGSPIECFVCDEVFGGFKVVEPSEENSHDKKQLDDLTHLRSSVQYISAPLTPPFLQQSLSVMLKQKLVENQVNDYKFSVKEEFLMRQNTQHYKFIWDGGQIEDEKFLAPKQQSKKLFDGSPKAAAPYNGDLYALLYQ